MKHLICISLLMIAVAAAQVKLEGTPEPRLANAKLQTLPAGTGLEATLSNLVRQHAQPAWVGYAVPIVPGQTRFVCCMDHWAGERMGCCAGCRLEKSGDNYTDSTGGTCVRSEPPTHLFVLLRIENGEIVKVRPFTPDCGLDVGGLDFLWLNDVKPADSVAWLAKQVSLSERRMDGAIQSIALHSDASADRALAQLTEGSQTRKVREQAAFWLAQDRGHAGFLQLQKLARNDSDDKFREQLAFDFTQSQDKEATQELLHMAKLDASPRVRSQALFWLSQKATHEATLAITDIMENDPDLAVKKKAIFALSQLPKDESVPLLIKYAKSHPNMAVRKEAMFWLGQSGDPRALDFLESILTGEK